MTLRATDSDSTPIPANQSAGPFVPDNQQQDQTRLKLLLIAPYFDKKVAGESWSTFKWIEGISQNHDVTVLTTHKKGWNPEDSPTAAKEIVNWTFHSLPSSLARLERELKPSYLRFYFRARCWIRRALRAGQSFDLVHQINPLALRYPCPARGLGLKYIMGPLAGSLQTPEGFRSESSDKQWYRKLRNLDSFRIKHDPWLRQSYTEAELILGVAPYVEEILKPAGIKRFEIASETGVESVIGTPKQPPAPGEPLRLLYVGRIIRTKGVIDAVRAVGIASKTCNIRFDVVGDGDMLEACKAEATKLGLNDIITFHGRVPRHEVDDWYQQAHVFLFPSFREPSGNVVFEAMGHGLPVITSDSGGPGYVVNENCGLIVKPIEPEQYARDLANAIEKLAHAPDLVDKLSHSALLRILELAEWPIKITSILGLYNGLIQTEPNEKTNTKKVC